MTRDDQQRRIDGIFKHVYVIITLLVRGKGASMLGSMVDVGWWMVDGGWWMVDGVSIIPESNVHGRAADQGSSEFPLGQRQAFLPTRMSDAASSNRIYQQAPAIRPFLVP